MGRIPLSDEFDLEDEVIEEEGTTGAEEQYEELDFDAPEAERGYEPDLWEDQWLDDESQWWEGDE